MDVRQHIMGTVDDLVAGLLYYDRKGDEDLPSGAIEAAIKDGDVTVDDMVARFKGALEEGLE